MELKLSDHTLVVFVDDTGHEALVPGHPVYGLGGCAVMASDLERTLRHPWHEVRRKVKGSPDAPLHAASLGHPPRPEDIATVAEFFRNQPFARIGAIIPNNAKRDDGITVMRIIASTLKQLILDIARWTPFTEVKVIFEASRRADFLIQDAFADFGLEENGKPIPVECYFMPKAANDPCLEVADFIMHAVGRQARRRVEGRDGFTPDFAAVFHGQDPKRVSFIEVSEVRVSSGAAEDKRGF
jgi:hypothetical protein